MLKSGCLSKEDAMLRRSSGNRLVYVVAALLGYGVWSAPLMRAQSGSFGTIVVTVQDQSGAVVSGADLELQSASTNDIRKGQTLGIGNYSFVNLPSGTYSLAVSRAGYTKQVFQKVVVQASQSTGVNVVLKVGAVTETVEVSESATPIIETTSNAVGSVIDMRQIEDLPLLGRDLGSLSTLIPGTSLSGDGLTWNGLPQVAQGNNIDGVIGSTSRMKFNGNSEPDATPRLENIQEMAVQTDQIDLDQGYGQANMQVSFITRSGTNKYHVRLFEDFRNSAMNANSWSNDAQGNPKPHLILNEFGASVGGPIIKDKLFFFGNFSMSKQPGGAPATNPILSANAEQGIFQYIDSSNNAQSVNLYQLAQNNSLPSTTNSVIGAQLPLVDNSKKAGVANPVPADPNLLNLTWNNSSPETHYYPTFRVDYNISPKYHVNVAFNQTKILQPGIGAAPLPGSTFANRAYGNKFLDYTAAFNFDWFKSPTLSNEFRAGYLYHAEHYAFNVTGSLLTQDQIPWALGTGGMTFPSPVDTFYPTISASDIVSWQHGAHNMKFGFSYWREQNHYWDPPFGNLNINLGLAGGDPVLNTPMFDAANFPGASSGQIGEAQNLYATLIGRVSFLGGRFIYDQKTQAYETGIHRYALDERVQGSGLFFQDSYRFRPNLTINYGLRWDFTGTDQDLTGAYHSATPGSVFGPSGDWNLFNPGSLNGNPNPTLAARGTPYHPWYKSPQPSLGITWDPGKDGKNIVRAGYSLRFFTEPQQYVWNVASDFGSFYYQFWQLAPGGNTQGFFPSGSLTLGQGNPDLHSINCSSGVSNLQYSCNPQTYVQSAPLSQYTFVGGPGANGVDPNLKQPYTQSWNLGIQHELSKSNVIEVRYVGNRTIHMWTLFNINETNIFQSGQYGFLTNFKAAQNNLAICMANPGCSANPSFANNGLAGQVDMPLFDAAFAGEGAGPDGHLVDYTNSSFINQYLQTGAAGPFAANVFTTVQGNAPYFCNLVGSGFSPCVNNINFPTGVAGVVPINFFQANPYATGPQGATYETAKGYATYNGLQVDFRQKQWHGMAFDANYTWSHTLGINSASNWVATTNAFTLRNLHMSYNPTLDLRHVIHVSGTYDLPFGKGKALLSNNKLLDRIVGGWTLGTFLTYRSGEAFEILGGYGTFNDISDGGVNFNGVTLSQLQSSVGVHRVPGETNLVDIIDPKYLKSPTGGANPTFLTSNTTAGTYGHIPFLYGPHGFYDDMSLSKNFPITERFRFKLQGEFLNIFNHPVFGRPDGNLADVNSWGTTGGPANGGPNMPFGFGRVVEVRANFEF